MVKYVKRSIIFVLICAVVLTGIPVVNAQYYSDVSKSALTREEFDSIMYVSDNGIMVGSDTGEFMPNSYVNRAQFVQVLFSNSGEKDDYYAGSTDFTDVVEGTWYYDAVCWAYDRELVSGTSSTTFDPARTITTAEVLAILYKYAEYMGTNTECRYESQPILSHSDHDSIVYWAEDAMNWALDYNILNPVSDSAPLNPTAYAKRKAIAVFMRNYEKEAIGFRDDSGSKKLFSFTNEEIYFYTDDDTEHYFCISDSYFNLLCRNIRQYYGANSTTANALIETINDHRSNPWGGSCFGMCAVTLFDVLGKIDFNTNTEGMMYMSDLPTPIESSDVRDGINYYQLTPYVLQYFRNDYGGNISKMRIGLANLASEVTHNGATLMDIRWREEDDGEVKVYGHSLIITEMYDIGDDWYLVCLYDPNIGYTEDWIRITEDAVIFKNHTLSSFGYYRNYALDELDFIDIDNVYNTEIDVESNGVESEVQMGESAGIDYLAEKTLIIVPAVDFTLRNNEGEYLHYSAEQIEGTMEVFYSKIISNGPNVAADLMLVVGNSESFDYTPPNTERQSIFIISDLLNASVVGENFASIHIDESGVEISEKDVEVSS